MLLCCLDPYFLIASFIPAAFVLIFFCVMSHLFLFKLQLSRVRLAHLLFDWRLRHQPQISLGFVGGFTRNPLCVPLCLSLLDFRLQKRNTASGHQAALAA